MKEHYIIICFLRQFMLARSSGPVWLIWLILLGRMTIMVVCILLFLGCVCQESPVYVCVQLEFLVVLRWVWGSINAALMLVCFKKVNFSNFVAGLYGTDSHQYSLCFQNVSTLRFYRLWLLPSVLGMISSSSVFTSVPIELLLLVLLLVCEYTLEYNGYLGRHRFSSLPINSQQRILYYSWSDANRVTPAGAHMRP